mmetsp:Transcript_37194/g.73044  ORF Transcript_37194/g.73044 Transcript_37194/m.73044 type:complete len:111 (+) Transcript_37194:240-572(+)
MMNVTGSGGLRGDVKAGRVQEAVPPPRVGGRSGFFVSTTFLTLFIEQILNGTENLSHSFPPETEVSLHALDHTFDVARAHQSENDHRRQHRELALANHNQQCFSIKVYLI